MPRIKLTAEADISVFQLLGSHKFEPPPSGNQVVLGKPSQIFVNHFFVSLSEASTSNKRINIRICAFFFADFEVK